MSLQRSKSAPHPISGLATSLPRVASFHHKQAKTGHVVTQLPTPRIEREDPFSLSGFFPTTLGEEDEWGWLRDEGSDKEEWGGLHGEELEEGGVIFGHTESGNVTQDAIKDEDKLGILSLGRSPPQNSKHLADA